MIIYALLSLLVTIISALLGGILTLIPALDSINQSIQPYITSLTTVINSGANLISFFLPVALLKVLIPIVITLEIVITNLDLIKFIMKKTINR